MNTDELVARDLELRATMLEHTAAALRSSAERLRDADPLDSRLLVSVDDAAAMAGLSVWTVRRMLADGRLDEVRQGRRRWVVRRSLDRLGEAS